VALQAMRLSRFLGGVLFVGLIHNPVEAFGTTLPAMSSVTLVWDGSPSSDVTSYRVYYGGPAGIIRTTPRWEDSHRDSDSGRLKSLHP